MRLSVKLRVPIHVSEPHKLNLEPILQGIYLPRDSARINDDFSFGGVI